MICRHRRPRDSIAPYCIVLNCVVHSSITISLCYQLSFLLLVVNASNKLIGHYENENEKKKKLSFLFLKHSYPNYFSVPFTNFIHTLIPGDIYISVYLSIYLSIYLFNSSASASNPVGSGKVRLRPPE